MSGRVAILGTGWGTRVQVPAFRRVGLEIAALWARSAAKAERAARDLEIPFAADDPSAVVTREEVDVVVVATPPHTHRRLALAALEAGKHVVCEKPTALDAGEAREMAEAAAARRDRLALIDHELRFLPVLRRMRQLLAEGLTGEILEVEGSWASAGRLDPDWRWDWWSDRERGGGTLGAVGSHVVDALAWLTGRPIEAVAARLGTAFEERRDESGRPRPVTSDDYAALLLRLAGGGGGVVRLSSAEPGARGTLRLAVAGRDGRLVYEGRRLLAFRRGRRGGEDLTPPDAPETLEGLPDHEWSRGTLHLGRALRIFLESGRREALAEAATFDDGLAVQRVLDAARHAADTGSWVPVEG